MKRKKKYENALIAKDIIERELNVIGETKGSLYVKFMDLENKGNRKILKGLLEDFVLKFNNALKELEEE